MISTSLIQTGQPGMKGGKPKQDPEEVGMISTCLIMTGLPGMIGMSFRPRSISDTLLTAHSSIGPAAHDRMRKNAYHARCKTKPAPLLIPARAHYSILSCQRTSTKMKHTYTSSCKAKKSLLKMELTFSMIIVQNISLFRHYNQPWNV